MKRYEGMHFYINIPNFNDVVNDEEVKTGKVNHSIHALDTFFSTIEAFGKSHFDSFVVEKITGSRLHMYITDEIKEAFVVVSEVASFALELSTYLNEEIGKYKSLNLFSIQVGACFGKFYDFEFDYEGVSEQTTIGYAANFAAKLQNMTAPSTIAVSANVYEALDQEYQCVFKIKHDSKLDKYDQEYYAVAPVSKLNSQIDFTSDFEKAKKYANNINLSDITFANVRKALDFSNLSKSNCRKVEGIPFFADVRGFTSQFEEDDSNLEEMAETTTNILSTMYKTVRKHHGVHVQFQGDREMALFHNYPDYDCVVDAVQTALRLIDEVKTFSVSIGIGESFGTLFAAKIGARSEKDNILLGNTVADADRLEDEHAGENQLAISPDVYNRLKELKPSWANRFAKVSDTCYRITIGYSGLVEAISAAQLKKNNQNNNYNKAWGEW